ncbi:MAG: EamA family transporter [Candidatus Rokuibacteriota bacterium]|nr:MAG: EamA family transporter [Candidatus Rokubacteria bacterium]
MVTRVSRGAIGDVITTLRSGAAPALLSAALFGASTPLAKLLLRGIDPWMLAGILYLGSGLGLISLRIVSRALGGIRGAEARVQGRGWLWLGSAILSGGVVGPVLLMIGLARSAAATAALLLNLEGVFTALLAWFVFRENFDRRIAAGMGAIVAGGLVLAGGGGDPVGGDPLGPIAIAAACLAWAIDNNLTRKVSSTDPVRIAMLKGCVAGAMNVAIARGLRSPWPDPGALALAGLVGFAGYGVSLVFFVVALRRIGTARTGAYFSLAPFFGGAIAVLVLRDAVTLPLVAAGVLMGVGVWLHLTERHEHAHEHREPGHEHRHAHDEHHQHAHDGSEPPGEPHSHWHAHARLRHHHRHYPDVHHRHDH